MILIIELNDNQACNRRALSNVKNIFVADCGFKNEQEFHARPVFFRECAIFRTYLTECSASLSKPVCRSNGHISLLYWNSFFVFLLTSFER